MIVEITTISHENYTPLIFETDRELEEEQIKKIIFEAFASAFKAITKRWKKSFTEGKTEIFNYPDAEAVLLSEDFTKELEKRGFNKIKGKINFTFWGWNSPNYFWEDDSEDIDRELWEFVKKEVSLDD